MSHESCYSDENREVATRVFEVGAVSADSLVDFLARPNGGSDVAVTVNSSDSLVAYA
jgi:hypothetical protein